MSQLLIQFSHLCKFFGPTTLFEDIALSISQGEIFALIGENGAGKTTLLRLLIGDCTPDSGTFIKSPNLTIGFLPQEIKLKDSSITMRSYIAEGPLTVLEQEMAASLENPDRLHQWAELHETYEQLGGYRRIPIEEMLNGLKLETHLLDLPMSQLSSGQKMRAALTKSLIENPDLLLLDEPTNHLDADMVEWLKNTLQIRKGATVIVSHDRSFINQTCNRLIEIRNGKLTCYGGNYDFYLNERKGVLERQMKAYEAQEEEKSLLKQKIKALTFSKAKPSPPSDRNLMAYDRRGEHHQKSLQRNLESLKARLAAIETSLLSHPKPKTIKGLYFHTTPLASPVVIELIEASKSYGTKVVFSHFSKMLMKGDRIVVTGPNGAGKTTLLRCIAQHLPIDSGQIRIAPTAKIAYLDQELELLPMDETPLEYFESRFHLSEESLRRELHKAGLEGADLIRRSFSSLSAGQRKRLMLLRLILEQPNVLLLDEPTNHLDLATLEAFENALLHFEGAILAVSHDSTFIEKIATEIWHL